MNQLEVFSKTDNYLTFEDFQKSNGDAFWLASDLAQMLGYSTFASFKKAINRATSICITLNITVTENFREVCNESGIVVDYRLTRFACYLTAMNADPRKLQVAGAQAYFITLAEAFRQYVQKANNVERVLVRHEISEHEISMSGIAKQAGVENYGFFQNAGYRGLYNMSYNKLKQYKGFSEYIGRRSLLDFMGKEELAANLFRITQTEAKILNDNIKGQRNLEKTAEIVGKEVRKTMIKISGHKPEDLPLTEDVEEVKKKLKVTHKKYKELDNKDIKDK